MTNSLKQLAKELYNICPVQIWDKRGFRKQEFSEMETEIQEGILNIAKHVQRMVLEAKIDELRNTTADVAICAKRLMELRKQLDSLK